MKTVVCPKCNSQNVRYREKRRNWICDDCDYVFTMPNAFAAQPEEVAGKPPKGKVFISYGHDCTTIVDRIMQGLTRLGYRVWVDNYQIKSGDDWRSTITNGILDSQVVLSFLSVHALRSGGVCLDELAIAVGCNHNNIRTCLMEQEAIEVQMLQADLECQAEQDAILDQIMLEELAYEAEQDAIADAFYQAELAAEAEEDAIADAFYMAELAAEAEEEAIADAFYQAELAREADEDAIADALFMADLARQNAMALPF